MTDHDRPEQPESSDRTGADAAGAPGGNERPRTGTTEELVDLLGEWLPRQRWFAGKGRTLGPVVVTSRSFVARVRGDAQIEHLLLTVPVGSGEHAAVHRYQMFLGWHPWLPEQLDHARIGSVADWTAYDALFDGEVAAVLLRLLADGGGAGDLRFEPEPDAVIDPLWPGTVIGAEQSNTSIVYGHRAILKVFRRLEPGPNPDAEVHRALHRRGSTQIATPLGVISGPVAGVDTTLALLTSFFDGSVEGWATATASVRDLMAEADLRADEVGGDFAGEAYRLGKAVARVHADLAAAFGTAAVTESEIQDLVHGMITTAEATAAVVPALAELLPAVRAGFASVAPAARAGGSPDAQRIHGDLHLGQTLRTVTGWAVIDFEGEPSKPLADRRAWHSPLRDVAGMLRSFDYAAHHSLAGNRPDAQHLYRAAEWAERNRDAFCAGYAAVTGSDPRTAGPLLAAFELDKAVYEVGYEHGHRPGWVPIPLSAVQRLTHTGGTP